MKKLFLTTALLSLLFMFSCGDDDTSGPTKESEIMPLKIGNMWVTQTYYTDKPIEIDEVTVNIVGDTTINNKNWFYFFDEDHDIFCFRNSEEGLHAGSYMEDNSFSSTLLFKYPCEIGDEYNMYDDGTLTVKSLNEEVTVPAGTFDCIKYQTNTRSGESWANYSVIYASPGVGVVKAVRFEKEDTTAAFKEYHIEELIEYNIN